MNIRDFPIKGKNRTQKILQNLAGLINLQLINKFYDRYIGEENRQVFYQIAEVCPELSILKKNYPIILEELKRN